MSKAHWSWQLWLRKRSAGVGGDAMGNLGHGRGTPQVLKETVKVVGPKTNNDIVFLRYVFERCRNVGSMFSIHYVHLLFPQYYNASISMVVSMHYSFNPVL